VFEREPVEGGRRAALLPRQRLHIAKSLYGPSLVLASIVAFHSPATLIAQSDGLVAGTVTGTRNTPLANARIKVLGTTSQPKANLTEPIGSQEWQRDIIP
jgi:hypothetical protein